MVKILAALSILNSSGASPGATEKVAALVTALPIYPWLVTLLHICGVIPTPQSQISRETPRRYRRKLRASADIDASEWRVFECFVMFYECFMMFHNVLRVFHNVLSVSWCFTSGSWCFTTFHDVSQCFTSVLWCFTMFNNILRCLVSRAMIAIPYSLMPWIDHWQILW